MFSGSPKRQFCTRSLTRQSNQPTFRCRGGYFINVLNNNKFAQEHYFLYVFLVNICLVCNMQNYLYS